MPQHHLTLPTTILLGAAVIGLGACARVKPDQLQSELAQIRQEMQAGDSNVAARVSANDQRVDQLDQRVGGVNTRLDSLQADLQAFRAEYNTTVQRMETALRFNVPVHFAFNQATVRAADRPVLDRFAKVMQQYYPNAHVTIEGFADPAGSASYNMRLGRKRAEAVRAYLTTSAGLAGVELKTVSYGEARDRQVAPGARGPGEEGAENRRVAFVIDYAGEEVPPQALVQ